MDVREIKDHTLELARAADRVEASFAARHDVAVNQFRTLLKTISQGTEKGIPPLIIRVTGVPTSPQFIPELTRKPDLWWKAKRFLLHVDDGSIECDYPLRETDQHPTIRLRSLVTEPNLSTDSLPRLLRSDGLVDLALVHPQQESALRKSSRLYVGWLVSMVVGAICQINHIRDRLAWDAVEFGIEVEVFSTPPLGVRWNNQGSSGSTLKTGLPLMFPRYSLAAGNSSDELISTLVRDLFDACGHSTNMTCKVPWDELRN